MTESGTSETLKSSTQSDGTKIQEAPMTEPDTFHAQAPTPAGGAQKEITLSASPAIKTNLQETKKVSEPRDVPSRLFSGFLANERLWHEVIVTLSYHESLKKLAKYTGETEQYDLYSTVVTTRRWSKLFAKTSLMGTLGTKSRILLLLMWILASHSQKEGVNTFVTSVLTDAIESRANQSKSYKPRENEDNHTFATTKLREYRRQVKTMVRELQLPLPSELENFLDKSANIDSNGGDRNQAAKDQSGFSPQSRYMTVDIASSPIMLLRRSEKILVPGNWKTERAMHWLISSFLLGKVANPSKQEDDSDVLWKVCFSPDPKQGQSDDAIKY